MLHLVRDTAARPLLRARLRPSVPAVFAAVMALAMLGVRAPAFAQPASPQPVPPRGSCAAHIAEAAQRFGVPERWIAAVMRQESGGRVGAISHAGAQGCMQIMPATWVELARLHGFGADTFEPRENMLAGAAYLRQMYDRYGTADAMLAAYNAGPGRYDEYRLRGRPLPAETLDYLARVGPAVGMPRFSAQAVGATEAPANPFAAPIFVRLSGGRATAGPQRDGIETSAVSAPAESPFLQSAGPSEAVPALVSGATQASLARETSALAAPIAVTSTSPDIVTKPAPHPLFVRISSEEHRP